jgi:hypothetical protein
VLLSVPFSLLVLIYVDLKNSLLAEPVPSTVFANKRLRYKRLLADVCLAGLLSVVIDTDVTDTESIQAAHSKLTQKSSLLLCLLLFGWAYA